MFTALAMLITAPRLSRKPGQSMNVTPSASLVATPGMNVMLLFEWPMGMTSGMAESGLTWSAFAPESSTKRSSAQPKHRLTSVLLPAPVLPMVITTLLPAALVASTAPMPMHPERSSSCSSTSSFAAGLASTLSTRPETFEGRRVSSGWRGLLLLLPLPPVATASTGGARPLPPLPSASAGGALGVGGDGRGAAGVVGGG
eukprot:783170-Pyramimonas_sp.AAC.1